MIVYMHTYKFSTLYFIYITLSLQGVLISP